MRSVRRQENRSGDFALVVMPERQGGYLVERFDCPLAAAVADPSGFFGCAEVEQ
jgi:hypothetical protein